MKLQLKQGRLRDLLYQRNLLVSAAVGSALLNLILATSLIFKQETVIIMPPEITQSFWIEKGRASSEYLEEMAQYFAYLILDVNPTSAAYQREILLKYALPESYGSLKRQLIEDEEKLVKENASTSFKPVEIKVSPSGYTVALSGDLISYVGDKKVSENRTNFIMKLSFKSGRLYIVSFQKLGEKQ